MFSPEKFSNVIVKGNHQENILKYRLLGCIPISNSIHLMGDMFSEVSQVMLLLVPGSAVENSGCLRPSLILPATSSLAKPAATLTL